MYISSWQIKIHFARQRPTKWMDKYRIGWMDEYRIGWMNIWSDGWMNIGLDGWMNIWLDGWIYDWMMDEYRIGWIDEYMIGWMNNYDWMDEYMIGWMNMNDWMDGWIYTRNHIMSSFFSKQYGWIYGGGEGSGQDGWMTWDIGCVMRWHESDWFGSREWAMIGWMNMEGLDLMDAIRLTLGLNVEKGTFSYINEWWWWWWWWHTGMSKP